MNSCWTLSPPLSPLFLLCLPLPPHFALMISLLIVVLFSPCPALTIFGSLLPLSPLSFFLSSLFLFVFLLSLSALSFSIPLFRLSYYLFILVDCCCCRAHCSSLVHGVSEFGGMKFLSPEERNRPNRIGRRERNRPNRISGRVGDL